MFAAAVPANAANFSAVSSTVTTFTAGSTSPVFTVSATQASANATTISDFSVEVPGWTTGLQTCSTNPATANNPSACGITFNINGTPAAASVYNQTAASGLFQIQLTTPTVYSTGTVYTVIFAAGAWNTPVGTPSMTAKVWKTGSLVVDQGSVAFTSNASVTFDANGGTGTMANQLAATSTVLNSNTFTNAGYSFGGWATSQQLAAAGTVAYANGASFPFRAASSTLYAIWTASSGGSTATPTATESGLASTGADLTPSGIAVFLMLAGAAFVLTRRVRQH